MTAMKIKPVGEYYVKGKLFTTPVVWEKDPVFRRSDVVKWLRAQFYEDYAGEDTGICDWIADEFEKLGDEP